MTSSPLEKGRIQLAVKSSRHHPVTRYLHERARVGEEVRISSGQGSFYVEPDMGGQLVLLGAGIGVTPLISILRFLRDSASSVSATLVYSVSAPEEILFREELESIDRDHRGLRCLFTLTGPASGWRGLRGRIDESLLRALELPSDARYFFCGSRDFVEGVGEVLRGVGVDEDRLFYEQWW